MTSHNGSVFELLRYCWKTTFGLFTPVVQRVGGTLLWWAVIIECINQGFVVLAKMPNDSLSMIGKINGFIVSGLLAPTVFIMITPVAAHDLLHKISPTNLTSNFKKSFNLLAIESLRMLGRIILWGLLFIVPGLYRMVLYFFVPYIVQFSKKYDAGQTDALEYSTQLFKSNWLSILIAAIAFLPFAEIPSYFLAKTDLMTSPGFFMLMFFINLTGQVFCDIGLLCIYEKLSVPFEEATR